MTALAENSVVLMLIEPFVLYTRATKGSSAWKIAGGVTAICGGGVAAVTLAYHYNTEFRRLIHENLSVIEPVLSSMDSYLDSITNTQTPAKLQGNAKSLPSVGGPLDLSIPNSGQKVR